MALSALCLVSAEPGGSLIMRRARNAAKVPGLTISHSFLQRANQVIE
jgi:hypothetical protein